MSEAGRAILLTAPSCSPATAKRTWGKGAEGPHRPGAMGLALGGREAASLAARPAQAVTPCPLLPCGGGEFRGRACERSVWLLRTVAGRLPVTGNPGALPVRESGTRGTLQTAAGALGLVRQLAVGD